MGIKVKLDLPWVFCFLAASAVFLYLMTYVSIDQVLALKGGLGLLLLIVGTFGAGLLVGFDYDQILDMNEFLSSFALVLVSLVAITMVNLMGQSAPLAAVDSPISAALFGMLIGISEEAFFRGFICTLAEKLSGNSIIGVFVSSIVGTTYHAAVYGTSDTLMGIVFGCFVVLGTCYVVSGHRLSVTMVAHALVNLLSAM